MKSQDGQLINKKPLLTLFPLKRATSLTKRALGEAPGSPREAESRRSAAHGGQGLLGKSPGGEGTDGASDSRHFEKQGGEEWEKKERRRGKWKV